MERLNRSAILESIRWEPGISRTGLARRLGLSLPTVSRIVGKLIREGLVREGEAVSAESATVGRRPTSLYFNHQAHTIIGVDLGGTNMVGVHADLGGNIRAEQTALSTPDGDTGGVLDRLFNLVASLLSAAEADRTRIRGIGIGAPGVVHADHGIVVWAPAFGWRDLHLKALMEERFGIPTFVENDVNLAALGEKWYGAAQGVENLISVFVGTGIGAGVIINGGLYRGHHDAAGEVGYIIPHPRFLGQRFDEFGCLETLASGPAIARRARELATGTSRLVQLAGGRWENVRAEHVFAAAREGDPLAQRIVEETVDYLAIMVADIISVLDPEMVVLGGGVARSDDLILEPLRRRIEGLVPAMPRLCISHLGDKAVVMGAVAYAIHATDEFVFVTT